MANRDASTSLQMSSGQQCQCKVKTICIFTFAHSCKLLQLIGEDRGHSPVVRCCMCDGGLNLCLIRALHAVFWEGTKTKWQQMSEITQQTEFWTMWHMLCHQLVELLLWWWRLYSVSFRTMWFSFILDWHRPWHQHSSVWVVQRFQTNSM